MTFEEYEREHLQGQSGEFIRLVRMGWNARGAYGYTNETGVTGHEHGGAGKCVDLHPVAQSKIRKMGGETCGVLVRSEAGIMAVTDLGRVTKLDDAVMGPVDRATGEEPLAWSGWACQYPGKMPRLYGDRVIAELNCNPENGDRLIFISTDTQPQSAGLPEGMPQAIDMLEDYASALGNGDLDGAGHSTTQAIHEVIDLLTTTPQPAGNWVRCSERLPEPRDSGRKAPNGILIKFDTGRITQIQDVTETLVARMKGGPRQPAKFEAPRVPRIVEWMDLDNPQPPQQGGLRP